MDIEEIEQEAYDAIEKEDFISAIEILRPIADERSPYALLTLGWMHDNALAVPQDKEIAQSYYIRAADAGSLAASHRLGWLFLEQGDEHKARAIFFNGAKQGSLSCMYEVGVMLIDGKGGEVDRKDGMDWLNRAANRGHFWSRRKLLGIEKKQTKSFLRKLFVNMRILVLGIQGGLAHFSDPSSERHQ
jgi:uncharacterized protein